MFKYSSVATSFINEKKDDYNSTKFIVGNSFFIIVDKNNTMRTSNSKSILDEEATIRIICIERKWANNRGNYNYNTIDSYILDEYGDIHSDIIIDYWNLSVTPSNLMAHNPNFPNYNFFFNKQKDYPTTLSHLWQTFLKLKECRNLDELMTFKTVYSLSNDKESLIKELKEKDIENEFLKKKVKAYENLLDKLENIINH